MLLMVLLLLVVVARVLELPVWGDYNHGATTESIMALTVLPSMVTFMAYAWISAAPLSSIPASAIAVSAAMGLEELAL